MKHLAAVLAALVLLAGCGGSVPAPGESKIDVDTPALREQKTAAGIETCVPGQGGGGDLPSLVLPCLGGGPDVDLSTVRGPVMINLWYSGCGPCRDEMPVLQKVHEDYADQVDVIGLDVETYPEAAISFAKSIGATYPQIADPGGTIFDGGGLGLRSAFPQTLLVDADGKVAYVQVGEIASLDEARELLKTYLGVTP